MASDSPIHLCDALWHECIMAPFTNSCSPCSSFTLDCTFPFHLVSFALQLSRLDHHLTFFASPPSAWQSQDIAPTSAGGGISIPTQDASMSNGAPEEQSWNNGSARSPGRGPGGEPPRRSSRSRSPGREDRRFVYLLTTWLPLIESYHLIAALMAVVTTLETTSTFRA